MPRLGVASGVAALGSRLGLWGPACTGATEPGAGPNVVLISVDTLRADHLGVYGYERDTSPSLDRFFAAGSVFESAMSSAPCTIPSVRQYLAGALDERPERPTLAEALKGAGYATAAIVSQHQFYRGGLAPYERGFDSFDIQGRREINQYRMTARRASEVSDRALVWLAEHGQGEKFFLWLHYFDPHDPYDPPEDFRLFDAEGKRARSGDRRAALRAFLAEVPTPPRRTQWLGEHLDPAQAAHFVARYDGEVRYVDAQIGRVLDDLAARGLVGRTIVVVIADHGEWLGERGRWDHCATLSDAEIRVPLLIRVNGRPLGEPRRAVAASTLDVTPTVLGLLGIPYDASAYHGIDLREASPERTAIAVWGRSRAIRDSEWKLLYQGDRPAFLYRVAADPEERWNLLDERPEVASRLTREMSRFEELSRAVGRENEETIEQLRAIGYIE